MEKTKKMTTLLTSKQTGMEKTSHGVSFTKYTNPEQITAQINQNLRTQKTKEIDLWEQLLQKAKYDFPSASEEKLTAIVLKQIEGLKRGQKDQEEADQFSFKPDLSRSQASKPPAPYKEPTRRQRQMMSEKNS